MAFSINSLLASYKSNCFYLQRFCTRSYSTRMSSVFVKNRDNDERLEITLDLNLSASNENTCLKSLNFSRLKHEELRLSVDRLRLSLSKKMAKKTKHKKKSGAGAKNECDAVEEKTIPIEIIHSGRVVDLSVSNENAWVDGAVLKIWEEEISISCNPPSVKLEKLPNTILAGFPVFPEAEFEFADMKSSEFYWEVFSENHLHKIKTAVAKGTFTLTNAVKSSSFTPQPDDVGRYVLLACVPRCGRKVGKMALTLSPCTVTAGPSSCPFEKRSEFTKEWSAEGE